MSVRAIHMRLIKIAEERVAAMGAPMSGALKLLLAGGAGAAAGAIPAYMLTREKDEEERLKTRNRAFGAGVATGVAGPHIISGVADLARNLGFMPSSEGM